MGYPQFYLASVPDQAEKVFAGSAEELLCQEPMMALQLPKWCRVRHLREKGMNRGYIYTDQNIWDHAICAFLALHIISEPRSTISRLSNALPAAVRSPGQMCLRLVLKIIAIERPHRPYTRWVALSNNTYGGPE